MSVLKVTEELVREAQQAVVISQFGSTAMLQRKFGFSFAQVNMVMETLEDRGVVGPKLPGTVGLRNVLVKAV